MTGNASRRPPGVDVPAEPLTVAPDPPDHLSDRGRNVWKQWAADLVARNLLAPADLTLLAILCQAWDDYLSALADIDANGSTGVTDKGYEYARPIVQIKNQSIAAIQQISRRFGLSPLDRVGLGGRETKPETEPTNPLENELGQKK